MLSFIHTFLLLLVISCSPLVWAQNGRSYNASVRNSVNQMVERSRGVTQRGPGCSPRTSCPAMLNTLHEDDKSDRLLGLLKSRYDACVRAVDSKFNSYVGRFTSAQDFQSYLEKERFSNLGALNHQPVRSCLTGGDTEARVRLSKYYYYMERYQRGAALSVQEIASVNSLLGLRPATQGLNCEDETFPVVAGRCKQLAACPASSAGTLADTAKAAQAAEAEYQALQKRVSELRRHCLNDEAEYTRHKAEIERTGSKRVCTQTFSRTDRLVEYCKNYDQQGLARIQLCQKQMEIAGTAMAVHEKIHPWFKDPEYFKKRQSGQSSESVIRASLQATRTKLLEVDRSIKKAARCLRGADPSCTEDFMRETLNMTPELKEEYGRDTRANVMNNYIFTQQCLEEGVADRDRTAATLRGLGRDALLTVATAGLGTVAYGGARALYTIGKTAKAVGTAANAARAATVGALGVDGFYATESFQQMQSECAEKLNVNLSEAEISNTCPKPDSRRVAAERAFGSCASAKAFAMLDALPLVPGVTALARVARSAPAERAASRAANAAPAPEQTLGEIMTAAPAPARPAPRRAPRVADSAAENRPVAATPAAEPAAPAAKAEAPAEVARPAAVVDEVRPAPAPVVARALPQENKTLADLPVRERHVNNPEFGGAHNEGIEILDGPDGRIFSKIVPERAADSLANEAKYAQILAEQKVGPKFYGTYRGADGKPRLAYQYVEGIDVSAGSMDGVRGIENIPDTAFEKMREINRKLVGQGINPVDIQYRVTKNGEVYVIDSAEFRPLPPALRNTMLAKLDDDIDELVEMKREVSRLTQAAPAPSAPGAARAAASPSAPTPSSAAPSASPVNGNADVAGMVNSYRTQIPTRLSEVDGMRIPGSSYRPVDTSAAVVRAEPTTGVSALRTPGTQAGTTRYSEIVEDGKTVGIFTKVLERNKRGFVAQGTKVRTEAEVAHEAYMTRLMSDLGYGPKYYGSRALPNGDFEISTAHIQGFDFNLNSRTFDKKVPHLTMEQIERAERMALDLNDRGIYSRDLQFMVSGDDVYVIDPERFEFMSNAARLVGRRESIISEFRDLKEARRRWEATQNRGPAPSARPTQEQMNQNAGLSPREKAEVFERVNNLPPGSVANDAARVRAIESIETRYPTPVSSTPAHARPRAEREALVAKREELRRLGFTDEQIRRGMDQGIFGAPSTGSLTPAQAARNTYDRYLRELQNTSNSYPPNRAGELIRQRDIATQNRLAAEAAVNLNRSQPGAVSESTIAGYWKAAAAAQERYLADELKANYKSGATRDFFVRYSSMIYSKEPALGHNQRAFREGVGRIAELQKRFDAAYELYMQAGNPEKAKEIILRSPLFQNVTDVNHYYDRTYLPHYRQHGTVGGASGLSY